MNNLNYIFFDEFKKLDNICKDLYDTSVEKKLGVTLYLDDMKRLQYTGNMNIPNWNYYYNRLKDARNKRNELAHSTTSLSHEICTQEDIDFIVEFKASILAQMDPIALLVNHNSPKSKPYLYKNRNKKNSPRSKKARNYLTWITLGALACAAIIWFISKL